MMEPLQDIIREGKQPAAQITRRANLRVRLAPAHETEFTLESFHAEMDAGGLVIEHLESRWGEIWAECRPQAE